MVPSVLNKLRSVIVACSVIWEDELDVRVDDDDPEEVLEPDEVLEIV